MRRLRERQEWMFFGVLPKADPALAIAWWAVLILRGVLPAIFAIAMGVLVGAVERGDGLAAPLAFVGAVFVLLQVLTPIHTAIGANLGDRTAAWLYDRLTAACVRPPGMGHLEDPKLTGDLTMARDFDLGIMGPLLLILDEPTAALDAETEHAVFERYAVAAREDGHSDDGRITILVSHRFSTVRMADRIVVLDGAHAVEVGTHAELMAKGGQYAELYGIQAAAYR